MTWLLLTLVAAGAQAAPPVPTPPAPSAAAAAPTPTPTDGAGAGAASEPSARRSAGGMPSPVPPTAEVMTPAPAPGADAASAALPGGETPADPRVVLTGDVTAAESDHDLVVGAWGIEVRSVATTLPVFSRRATTGCPIAPSGSAGSDCPPVSISMLTVRHWVNRNLAWTAGAALSLGGGRQGERLLDSYFGFGPSAGLSLLLGNWRHLAVAASPSLMLVWFRAAGSAPSTYVADLRADLEAELHFGFVGVPALSLGLRSGILLRLEKAAELTLWSAGVSGATSLRGLVSDLSLRYYF